MPMWTGRKFASDIFKTMHSFKAQNKRKGKRGQNKENCLSTNPFPLLETTD